MAGTILQEVLASSGGPFQSSISVTLPNNATPGSVFHVFASAPSSGWSSGNPTFSDGTNTYVAIGAVTDTGGGQRVGHAYVANNSTSGKTVITFTPPTSNGFLSIWVREIGGVKNQAPDGTITTFVSSATSNPSASGSNSNQPAFLSALCADNDLGITPTVTGSLSAGATGWTFGGSTNTACTGQEALTTTGSQSATFHLPSSDVCTILGAIWDLPAAGAAFASSSTAKNVGKSGLTTSIKPASASKNVATGKASATTSIKPVAGGRAKSTGAGVPTTVIAAVSHALAKSAGTSAPTTAIRAASAAGAKSTGLSTLSIQVTGPTAAGSAKATATAAVTTAIRASAGGSSKATAISAPTTTIAASGASRAVSRGGSTLTTSSPLVSQAAARNAGRSAATTHIPLAGAARDVSSGRVAFANNALNPIHGAAVSSGKGRVTAWASVTLTSPLYTGEGSIVGPHAMWSAGAPGVGAVVYYDPTNMTVLPDGTVVATSNNFKAELQWLPSPGVASFLPLLVTGGFASWSQNASAGRGEPGTAITLLSSAHEVNSGRSGLTTRSPILAHAAAKNTAVASGFITGIALRSNSGARSSAGGAPATAINLVAHAQNALTARGAPGQGALFSSTSRSRSTGLSAPTTHIAFVSFPRSVSTGAGAPAFGAQFVSACGAASAARAQLRTAVDLASVSYSVSAASSRGNTELVSRASSSRSTGLLSGVTPGRFGWAEVIALSQDGFQSVESAYAENSAVYVQATYFDDQNNPFVPNAVTYRVDDVTSGINIVPTTSIEPEETNIVNIPASENYMVNATRDSEQHQAVFEITDGFGNVAIEQTVFDVLRVSGT